MQVFSKFHQKAETLVALLSTEDVWRCHLENMSDYGFSRLFYVLTDSGKSSMWGDRFDWLLLTNHHQEVIDVFIGEDLYTQAAKVVAPKTGQRATGWDKGYASKPIASLTKAEQKHADLCKKWNINSGYSIWFPEQGYRRKGVIGLCAKSGMSQTEVDEVWKEFGGEILALNNLMHLKISSLPHNGQRRPLTSRQREVLNWVADGKTNRDIATIMDLSLSTVEKHMRHAREALNAETTASAVAKAAVLNQLFLLDSS